MPEPSNASTSSAFPLSFPKPPTPPNLTFSTSPRHFFNKYLPPQLATPALHLQIVDIQIHSWPTRPRDPTSPRPATTSTKSSPHRVKPDRTSHSDVLLLEGFRKIFTSRTAFFLTSSRYMNRGDKALDHWVKIYLIKPKRTYNLAPDDVTMRTINDFSA